MSKDLYGIVKHFNIPGTFAGAEPYGSGHINDTFASVFKTEGQNIRYIHQKINLSIFRDIELLMRNIENVTLYIRQRLKEEGVVDIDRRCLSLVDTTDGGSLYREADGSCWRTYRFVENSSTYNVVKNRELAFEAAKAFGEFQYYLADYSGEELSETIPDFHNTPKRLQDLKEALVSCENGRSDEVKEELSFIFEREKLLSSLIDLHIDGKIKKRITHNDTKLNNVLIDNDTGEGLCIIDLDTVMPGFIHYDFGDLVRTSTSPADEDEENTELIYMQMDMYKAVAEGFYKGMRGEIRGDEFLTLPLGALLITVETAIRFLTDFLQGDKYFKIHRDKHNLIRCRAQLALAASIEANLEEMQDFLLKLEKR